MTGEEARDSLGRLIAGVEAEETRVLCLAVLQRWRSSHGGSHTFELHKNVVSGLITLLAERNSATLTEQESRLMLERYHQQPEEFQQNVLDFVWRFVQAGFAFPLGAGNGNVVEHYRLTRRGMRFLETKEDHPLLPGFLQSIRTKCPGIPDGVVSMLVDSRRCLEHALLRPAVIVLGVAYEIAIESVAENLATKGLVSKSTPELDAGPRIKNIKTALAKPDMAIAMPRKEDRQAAANAMDFADELREQRNLGVHTAIEFEDRAETEEFIVSAGRHLPALWSLAIC